MQRMETLNMQAADLLARAQELRLEAQRQGLDLNAANLLVHTSLMQSLNVPLARTPEQQERRGQDSNTDLSSAAH
jgi:hypothetical protein